MNGVHGFVRRPCAAPRQVLEAMVGATSTLAPTESDHGTSHGLAAIGRASTTALHRRGHQRVALYGHPYWEANGSRDTDIRAVAARLANAFAERGESALGGLHGDFAVAIVDPERELALLAVDRMSVQNIVYGEFGEGFAFGPSCDALAQVPGASAQVDPQQVFSYLYFHMIPGPATIYRGWRRVPPGHWVRYASGDSHR